MFPPVKRVCFRENKLTETLPTPALEDSSSDREESRDSSTLTEKDHQRRREEIQAEDGHATAGHNRRKRRREWVWRPTDDDVLMQHRFDCGANRQETLADERSQGSDHPERKAGSPTITSLPELVMEKDLADSGNRAGSPTSIPLPLSAVEENHHDKASIH